MLHWRAAGARDEEVIWLPLTIRCSCCCPWRPVSKNVGTLDEFARLVCDPLVDVGVVALCVRRQVLLQCATSLTSASYSSWR
jgi:hypothetical protein